MGTDSAALNRHESEPSRASLGVAFMAAYGLAVLVPGWQITSKILAMSGQWPERLVFGATFSPLWLGAMIGLGVARGAHRGGAPGLRLPVLISVLISLPVALTDPWAIVALRMGSGAPIALKVLLLFLPVLSALVFCMLGGLPGSWQRRLVRVVLGGIGLAAVTAAAYVLIYFVILPRANFIQWLK